MLSYGPRPDDSPLTRIPTFNRATVSQPNDGVAQGPHTPLPITIDPARRKPKLVAPLPAKFGCQPADSESTAQWYLGPPPPSGQAKVATHHYQVRTTRLDARPDLPPLYGPSSGRQPADSESNARLYRHVRTVITNSATRDNGQPPIPICVAALPDLPLLNGPSPPQDRLR